VETLVVALGRCGATRPATTKRIRERGKGPWWLPVVEVSHPVQAHVPQRGRPQGPHPLILILPRPYGQTCTFPKKPLPERDDAGSLRPVFKKSDRMVESLIESKMVMKGHSI
jgi:hypothetical protein